MAMDSTQKRCFSLINSNIEISATSIENRESSIKHPALYHKNARSNLIMVCFPTFHWLEHEKARSHLTMVRFQTFHRLEHEKARSHLTIRLKIRDTFDGAAGTERTQ